MEAEVYSLKTDKGHRKACAHKPYRVLLSFRIWYVHTAMVLLQGTKQEGE